jgi:hypothetical protein
MLPPKNNVVDLDDHRQDLRYTVMAMCLACKHKWIGSALIETSLFYLECPQCSVQDSFATFIPQEYCDHLEAWAKANEVDETEEE